MVLPLENTLLGRGRFGNRREYIRAVRKGVGGQVARDAVKLLGRPVVARVLGTSQGNLSRCYRRTLTRAESEGLLHALRLLAYASAVLGNEDRALEWLGAAVPALGNRRPLDLCDTFEGRSFVGEVLQKIEHGEFS